MIFTILTLEKIKISVCDLCVISLIFDKLHLRYDKLLIRHIVNSFFFFLAKIK